VWRAIALGLVPVWLAIVGCGAEAILDQGGGDGNPDVGDDTGVDTGDDTDAGVDTGVDTGIDTTPDLTDVAEDTTPDGADSGPDAADTGDVGTDVSTDVATDTSSWDNVAPRYPAGRTQSPITPAVADRMADIVSGGEGFEDVFMKVGDSITADTNFMTCFAGDDVDLGDRDDLETAWTFFLGADLGSGVTSFDRIGDAAEGSRTAAWAVDDDPAPSPVASEIDAIAPMSAIVMFGTNDIGWFDDFGDVLRWYGENMLVLVDTMLDAGVVPILSSIPPITDDDLVDIINNRRVPTFNAIVRGLAQAQRIPFVDFHRELMAIPLDPFNHGLWPDGVHPNAHPLGACIFTEEGLQYGQNVRNLISLDALDRVRRILVEARRRPTRRRRPWLEGSGTTADPFVIDSLPFTDYRDTSESEVSERDAYPNCDDNDQIESGPEYLYRLELDAETALRAIVMDRAGVDVDIHLLGESGSADSCTARNDVVLAGTLAAGTYVISVDTFVSAAVEQAGEYLFVVVACESGDADCE
jgi:hypothetical protein